MGDPNFMRDNTNEWEAELDKRKSPKIKFPVKATSENIDPFSEEFVDPEIPNPKPKKKESKTNQPKVVDLSGSKRKSKSKPKLF